MRRADRLFLLLQALRRARGPVTAQTLADALEVSRRTVYRDMLDLQAARVPIDGAAGVGYIMRPGYDLPPLMFTADELEAIVLGMRLVADRGDAALVLAGADVVAKVRAVLPGAGTGLDAPLVVPPRPAEIADFGLHQPALRQAIRERLKLCVSYADAGGALSDRTVWPLALFYQSHLGHLGAWCEARGDYRFFRLDRLQGVAVGADRFADPGGRHRAAAMARYAARSSAG